MKVEATANRDRPLRRDARRNRERIVDAARELFAVHGVDATLDDVAARAGVGVATVYRRYPNKDALLDELVEERIAELAASAEEALATADAWEALIGFLERLESLSAANRALEHLVMRGDGVRKHERVARARARLLEPIATLVDRARKQGRLRADFDPADVPIVHAMIAAVVRETHEADPDLWRRYFALIVDGLASERATATELGIAPPPARHGR